MGCQFTYHKDTRHVENNSNRGNNPINPISRRPSENKDSAGRNQCRKNGRKKSMFRGADSMLISIRLIVELDQRQVCAGPEEAGYNNAQENGSHNTRRESVNLGENNREGFKVRVLSAFC